VKLTGGRVYTEEVIVPKGERENPMRVRDIEEKFLALVVPVLGDAKAKSLIDEVASLSIRSSLEPLIEALTMAV
jgi:2-methylcitrate dehydratase PrpD